MPYEIVRFPHAGTIDADGHVLEEQRRRGPVERGPRAR